MLLTGATGFLGAFLLDELLRRRDAPFSPADLQRVCDHINARNRAAKDVSKECEPPDGRLIPCSSSRRAVETSEGRHVTMRRKTPCCPKE